MKTCLFATDVIDNKLSDHRLLIHNGVLYPNWGLWMMPDKKFKISPVTIEEMYKLAEFPQLVNRLILWELTDGNDSKYIALAHLPFNQSLSTNTGDHYKQLITSILNKYQH